MLMSLEEKLTAVSDALTAKSTSRTHHEATDLRPRLSLLLVGHMCVVVSFIIISSLPRERE